MARAREYDRAVARGVRFLDQRLDPGWVHLVELPRFDISNGCYCVLGMVYAEDQRREVDGVDFRRSAWSVAVAALDLYVHGAVRMGFDAGTLADGTYLDYTGLQEAWRERLEELQEERLALKSQ